MPILRPGSLSSQVTVAGASVVVRDDGVLEGTAAPGTIVEVNNLSTLPTGDGVVDDAFELTRAGPDGRFSQAVPGAVAGDVLHVQLRAPQERVATTLQLRVDAARGHFDPRAAMIRLERLRVEAQIDGTVVIEPRTRQPVSEPDAHVRFKNARTGDVVDVTIDAMGRIPSVRLPASVGDRVDVAVSDGTGNLDFGIVAGQLDVVARGPLVQPAPLLKDRGFVRLLPLDGPLFLPGGPGFGRQGSIGNCPVPAACVALAAVDPAAVRDLIRDHGDGTYTVTFHPPGRPPVEIVVDHFVWSDGRTPRYGTADTDAASGGLERWFPLVEKAYAAYVGDYEVLGQGTSVGKVLSEVTGRTTREVWTNATSVDDVWRELERGAARRLPMAAGTWGTSSAALYRGTGVYANHAYSVVGIEEQGGRRLVTLRNPWGTGAASQGRVGATDVGVFQMKVEDFCRLFQVLNVS
jgi:hypothetical protein